MQAVHLITDPAYDVIQVLGIAQDRDGGQWQDFLEECAVCREKEAGGVVGGGWGVVRIPP